MLLASPMRDWILRVSPGSAPGESDSQAPGAKLPEVHPDSPRLARDAVVLGSGEVDNQDSIMSSDSRWPSDSTIQQTLHRDLLNLNLHTWLLESWPLENKDSLIQWQHELRLLREVHPEPSYEAKWSVFVRTCESNQVDFTSSSLTQVADFLMHLFQERKLQPSTIDGYRSVIADKIGNAQINVSRNEDVNWLLDSFHWDRPKGRCGIPTWNLSLVLHQLTKAPFEPLKALASEKRRS